MRSKAGKLKKTHLNTRFSCEINDRHKALFPVLNEARSRSNRVKMQYDKLSINTIPWNKINE